MAQGFIQVVSLDWKWLFIYPDQGIATVNTLTVPAGAPLHFELTSASVMNVFFIPQFGHCAAPRLTCIKDRLSDSPTNKRWLQSSLDARQPA